MPNQDMNLKQANRQSKRKNCLESAYFLSQESPTPLVPRAKKMLLGLSVVGNSRCVGDHITKIAQIASVHQLTELHMVVGDSLQEESLKLQYPQTYREEALKLGEQYFKDNLEYFCVGMALDDETTESIVKMVQTDVNQALKLYNEAVSTHQHPRITLSRWTALEVVDFDRKAIRKIFLENDQLQRALNEAALKFTYKKQAEAGLTKSKKQVGKGVSQEENAKQQEISYNYLSRELLELAWKVCSGNFDYISYPGEIYPFFQLGIDCLLSSELCRTAEVKPSCVEIRFNYVQKSPDIRPVDSQGNSSSPPSDDEEEKQLTLAIAGADYPACVRADALCKLSLARLNLNVELVAKQSPPPRKSPQGTPRPDGDPLVPPFVATTGQTLFSTPRQQPTKKTILPSSPPQNHQQPRMEPELVTRGDSVGNGSLLGQKFVGMEKVEGQDLPDIVNHQAQSNTQNVLKVGGIVFVALGVFSLFKHNPTGAQNLFTSSACFSK
ncbi:MAG: hypothetical protein NTW08_04185 [Gammaproteobacteria bacterium]|nr:hypothetical protein [Gammaproteobacteria bacterium]